ncbi:hypothetical protein [Mangrovivirga cuniculi]|uniref:Lipoprotein n=1 Tax=Mangrovivirga cuniculi TaxID=2715131 RepID=A0A4D7JHU8_9BACT|nr:hypothetical protein [Mangrovivirga cuniculi]QCK15589.1 hypothetical protein DCC35_12940 [Mangrovivirga cuniculi]
MKNYLLILILSTLLGCQSDQEKSIAENQMEKQTISEFESNNSEISRAIEKIALELSEDELDSFYVSEIDQSPDSIKIILYHYKLISKLNSKDQSDNEWVVLPPYSAMPEWVKQYKYSIEEDDLSKNPIK